MISSGSFVGLRQRSSSGAPQFGRVPGDLVDSRVYYGGYYLWQYRLLPLHLAAKEGHTSIVRVMLNHPKDKAEINKIDEPRSKGRNLLTNSINYYFCSTDGTSLHQASLNGHVEVVVEVLNHQDFNMADTHDGDFGCMYHSAFGSLERSH